MTGLPACPDLLGEFADAEARARGAKTVESIAISVAWTRSTLFNAAVRLDEAVGDGEGGRR